MRKSVQASSLSFQLAPDHVTQAHNALLQWYAHEQRDLPWRATSDPYAILVSEIMLQQTQVDRVLPKYQQFLSAFPTLLTNSSNSRESVVIQQEQLPALHTASRSLPSIPIYAGCCIASSLDWNILNPRLTTPKCLV